MSNRLAVLVPTRSRPQNIEPIIQAWWQTGAFAVADLIFGADLDDMRFDEYKAIIDSHPEVHLGILPEWKPMVHKLDFMARLAAADPQYLAVAFMGDDHVPRTPMWAHTLIKDHSMNRSWIWYGQDGFQNHNVPTWWSMDARIIRKLDRMVPAPVQHLYCDNAVKALGDAAGCLGYDETILIEHMHPIVGKGKMDAQYERVNRAQQYERDGALFHRWVAEGLQADATLIRSIGG